MLPPIPQATLEANPNFAALYSKLSSTVLDPADASTRGVSKPNDALDQVRNTTAGLKTLVSRSPF